MKHKRSYYNICTKTKSGYIVYNTLYNALVRMSEEEYAFLMSEDESIPDSVAAQFVENGLWVDSSVDEYSRYLQIASTVRSTNIHYYSLTIATTMQCNARCAYCYEAGVAQKPMSSETEARLYDFIDRLEKKDRLQLTWFGGEPLMNTGLINRLSEYLTEKEIEFSSFIITNGSLISDDTIVSMKEKWNITEVQITLDGIADEYDRRKNYIDGKKHFFKILDTIEKLCQNDICVHIRMNISKDNTEDCIVLAELLQRKFGKYENFSYYPAFVVGSQDKYTDAEKLDVIRRFVNSDISSPQKLTITRRLHSVPAIRACMYTDPYSLAIDTNGYIYNCEHNLGHPDISIGTLSDNAAELKKHELTLPAECQSCKFLPKCMGGCNSDRASGDGGCMIDKYLIQAYIESL